MKAEGRRQRAKVKRKDVPPYVSVIIPVYNTGLFLRECLDSVLAQTMRDFEVICINDGSTDNSRKILTEYSKRDARIKVMSKKNAGVSAARNDGIKSAGGEYIHFLDADDFIDNNYYEKMLRAAVAADADISAGGFVSNSRYTVGMEYKKDAVVSGLYGMLKKTNALVDSYIWRYLFRRDFILKNKFKFRNDLIAQEDTLFLLDAIARANRVAIAAGTNYHYMFNTDSALNSRDAAHRDKVKRQYALGRKFRAEFARKNNVMSLWRMRKFQKLPFVGKWFR